MIELGMTDAECLDYMERFTYLPNILLKYADGYYSSGDVSYAVELLKKGKIRDAEHITACRDYSRKLIDYYEAQEMQDELIEELKFQATELYQNNLHYVNKLKDAIDEEDWIRVREELLDSENGAGIKLELLRQEGLLDRLMEEIRNLGNIISLDRYEKYLRGEYGREIAGMYASYIRKAAVNSSNRNSYKNLMQYLRKIRRYKGCEELASEIAEEWKTEYKRRPAMMDELRKAGF